MNLRSKLSLEWTSASWLRPLSFDVMRPISALLIGCSLVLSGTGCSPSSPSTRPVEAWGNQLTLEVPAGTFQIPFLGESRHQSIVAEVTFTELDNVGRWAPSAFVGFRSAEGKTQFKALLAQDNPADTTLFSGYQLVKDGEAQTLKSLVNNIPLYEPIAFKVARVAGGDILVQVAGSDAVVIGNTSSELLPFITISSAKAKLSWTVR